MRAGPDAVVDVCTDVFATMVDGEPGLLRSRGGETPVYVTPLHAWVDIAGTYPVRVLLSAEAATADQIARALVGAEPGEELDGAEVVDAVGEVANMLAGNLKARMSAGGSLGLPEVDRAEPGGTTQVRVVLDWRGHGITVSVLGLADGTRNG
ncbi:chemotaxis protein CheX [Georgenia sp. SYP-B2076]|uniref:chemotaxis protein CheX n=1 Tax=Georgenia sp. SYP-B2076 TaxID=2495881 RepID=UPI000F8F4F79|nr:chemotaxis protein CheX [Georgenia sp. SYP-B2076]